MSLKCLFRSKKYKEDYYEDDPEQGYDGPDYPGDGYDNGYNGINHSQGYDNSYKEGDPSMYNGPVSYEGIEDIEDDYSYEDDPDYKRRYRRPHKNRGVVLLGCIFSLLMAAMLTYIVYYSYSNRKELISNSYNKRSVQLAKENLRGRIVSSDGYDLAYSEVDEKGEDHRVYPFGNEFAHVVGYNILGGSGIEKISDYYLMRSDASLSTRADAMDKGQKFPGNNVYSTINASLQRLAYYSLGDYDGAVIVSDPKTGRILAMVSKPDFDPNTIADNWKSLSQDKESSVLLNRATGGLYPPGSTFKIVTALEYIREHPAGYNDYKFHCQGSFTKDDTSVKCYHGSVHGNVDFYGSFAQSCNSSFANMGLELDQKKFSSTLDKLLFGHELPTELPSAVSRAEASKGLSVHDRMQLSIGQGKTLVTPLHMNMITMAIANDGLLMKPYLVELVKTSDGHVLENTEPKEYGRLMSQEEADILTEMMTKVVEEGTGSGLKSASYHAAGKTGSAEYMTGKTDSHAWFTGFAPASDPRICVTVIMEKAGSGGRMAVPVAKRIFDEYFRVYNYGD
ncbi:peptidoglycan D,D-transpeptidase FtsI family protein [Butyrivibrio sp. MC2013]|uniref:peptidoglycan D,D-transpeptidase FtsI family protein n=1 Tax=Butyrivibrio sp. MC2013 TaxID=1280686 RepID=UPI0004085FA8|nr:penicillin-binding transpeptidase domain-containing protein [Butyrivibrio sp. MC2013]